VTHRLDRPTPQSRRAIPENLFSKNSGRLTDDPTLFTVVRLEVEWLKQWLSQVTADDGKGVVVSNS
jgi:hypothetical protein